MLQLTLPCVSADVVTTLLSHGHRVRYQVLHKKTLNVAQSNKSHKSYNFHIHAHVQGIMFKPLMTPGFLCLKRVPKLAQTPAVPRSLSSPASLAALRLCSADWPLLLACIGTEFCGRLTTIRAARRNRVQAKRLLIRHRQERPRSNRTSAASAKPPCDRYIIL